MELHSPPWESQRLFSEYYLEERFPKTDVVTRTAQSELEHTFEEIKAQYTPENTTQTANEFELEDAFIKPVLEMLGHSYETQQTVHETSRRPDYAFFSSDAAARTAYERDQRGEDFYKDAIAVGDAKRWELALEDEYGTTSFDNPAYQLHNYLEQTDCDWGILTNGRRWRLYGPDSYRLNTYYEVDLGAIVNADDLEAFKHFYFFFRQEAFIPDDSGECFLDHVHQQSVSIADELSDDLKDSVYEALRELATGFHAHPTNDLSDVSPTTVQRGSFLLLYRIMFMLYCEHSDDALLPVDDPAYEEYYSIDTLKHDIEAEFDAPVTAYTDEHTRLWSRLTSLFNLLSDGSTETRVPDDAINLPVYGRRLFGSQTDPGEFLTDHVIGDRYLARAIHLVTRAEAASGNEVFVDYSALNIQHLGSIYEEFIEHELHVAEQSLVEDPDADAGTTYIPLTESDREEPDVPAETAYFTLEGERQAATGSFYTPDAVATEIVDSTIDPLLDEIRAELEQVDAYDTSYARDFTKRVLALDIVDPAMGSGHFLVGVIESLAEALIEAQRRQAQQSDSRSFLVHDMHWARRQVAQNCVYGVDRNPFAVQLAKLSVWLRTASDDGPLVYLDDRFRVGNSLAGWGAPPAQTPGDTPTQSPATPPVDGVPTPAEINAAYAPSTDRTPDFGDANLHLETDGGAVGLEAYVTAAQTRCSQPPSGLTDVDAAFAASETVANHAFKRAVTLFADTQLAAGFTDAIGAAECEAAWEVVQGERDAEEVMATEWYADVEAVVEQHQPFHWWVEFPEVFAEALTPETVTESAPYTTDRDGAEDSVAAHATAGFDAVIGNPPYMGSQSMQNHLSAEADYYREVYATPTGNYNLYAPFLERGYSLLRRGGFVGYILPHKFFHTEFGAPLREFIADRDALYKVVSFGHTQVWETVSTYTCLLFLRRAPNPQFAYAETTVDELEAGDVSYRAIRATEYGREAWVFQDRTTNTILEALQADSTRFDDLANIYVGLQTSADSVYVVEPVEEKLTTTRVKGADGDIWELDNRLLRPYLYGKDVHRYEEPTARKYVVFPYEYTTTDADAADESQATAASAATATGEGTANADEGSYEFIPEDDLEARFPSVYEYFETHKDTLMSRSSVTEERWYDFGRPQNLEHFDKTKILTPSISYECNFTYDTTGMTHKEKVYGILLNDGTGYTERGLLAVLNSDIPWYYLLKTGYTFRDGFRTFKTKYLGPIPLPAVPVSETESSDRVVAARETAEERVTEYLEDAPRDSLPPSVFEDEAPKQAVVAVLDGLAEQMLELSAERDAVSLKFADYVPVDSVETATTLGERATANLRTERPAILTSTRDVFKYDKLRVGRAETEYNESAKTLTVSATARYKPDDPDEDTGPYGFVETEPFTAFTLEDVAPLEAVLYSEFIEYAVGEAGGVADFREKATKSHTLIDRFEALELPDVETVWESVAEYRDAVATAERLEARLQKVDTVIDQLVYDLYGLTAEEIGEIERTVEKHRTLEG